MRIVINKPSSLGTTESGAAWRFEVDGPITIDRCTDPVGCKAEECCACLEQIRMLRGEVNRLETEKRGVPVEPVADDQMAAQREQASVPAKMILEIFGVHDFNPTYTRKRHLVENVLLNVMLKERLAGLNRLDATLKVASEALHKGRDQGCACRRTEVEDETHGEVPGA
jgi:hypothetical protein